MIMNIYLFLYATGKLFVPFITTINSGEEREKKLIEDACKGNLEAFEEVIKIYMKWAYTLAYRLSGEHFIAEEISQEAFIALYQNINRFRQESTLKTYLSRIILNLWRQHLRKRYREEKLTEMLKSKMKDGKNLMDEIENDNLKTKIDCAIDTLPPKQKIIFVLKHLEGLKISEIAEIVGCREGTVKAHLFKALINLRKQLK